MINVFNISNLKKKEINFSYFQKHRKIIFNNSYCPAFENVGGKKPGFIFVIPLWS